MRVKVHVVMWVGGGVVVHAERRQTVPRLTLPGGRVRDREPLEAALEREIAEELDARAKVGALHYVAEVVHGHSLHEVVFVFGGQPLGTLSADVPVIDPGAPYGDVLPPILPQIAADGPDGPPAPRWLGNIWVPGA